MSIRAVVFDFGNVLGFFSHRRAAEQLAAFASNPVSTDDIIQHLFYSDLEPLFEVGGISPEEVLAGLRRQFDLTGTDEELAHAFADMFTPNEAVTPLVSGLRGRYLLALLSNTNDLHYRLFRRQFAPVLEQFDHLFVSHEVGLRKPHPDIYDYVVARLGVKPEECVFIDDLPANIEAARSQGWQGILYRRGDDLRHLLSQVGVHPAS